MLLRNSVSVQLESDQIHSHTEYGNEEKNYDKIRIEIKNFRQRLQIELEDSPSLKDFVLEILDKSYQMALDNVRDGYPDVYFSDVFPFPQDVDALLNQKFWKE